METTKNGTAVGRCDCCEGVNAVRAETTIAKLADFIGEQP